MDEASSTPSEELSTSERGTSNTTLAALVVVVLLVTIIGTWTVLTSINNGQLQTLNAARQDTDSGKISVTIAPPHVPENSQATGLVTLTINKKV